MLTDVWDEFVALLKDGSLAADKIRPYHESLQESLPGLLETMRTKANWTEWQASPEMHQVGSQVHFLLPLTFDGESRTFCFSFLVDEGRWYWQHVESIVIRMDQLASLPTTEFPDVPEAQKAWIREEHRVTEQVHLFRWLVDEKGRSSAFDWFKDGAGYVLAARTWIPFVEISRAFILYVCWEQTNLRGNRVTLVKLEEREALAEAGRSISSCTARRAICNSRSLGRTIGSCSRRSGRTGLVTRGGSSRSHTMATSAHCVSLRYQQTDLDFWQIAHSHAFLHRLPALSPKGDRHKCVRQGA
jgi:hypothetical protein